VSLTEFLIIYLSAGAPFGVLLLSGRRSKLSSESLIHTILATLFWPYVAISRVFRHYEKSLRKTTLLRRNDPSRVIKTGNIRPREMGFLVTPTELDVIEGYTELTAALKESSSQENKLESAELFKIAGHSNPRLGALCLARSRRINLSRKQNSAAASLVHLFDRNIADGSTTSLQEISALCNELGDSQTASLIESLRQGKLKLTGSAQNFGVSKSEKVEQLI